MWIFTACFFILLIAFVIALHSSRHYRRAHDDQLQRNNVLKLQLAIYEYQHHFGCLPRNNQDLRRVMPEHQEPVYINPYDGVRCGYTDQVLKSPYALSGMICYEYCPAKGARRERIIIRAYGCNRKCLRETWVPYFHGVNIVAV